MENLLELLLRVNNTEETEIKLVKEIMIIKVESKRLDKIIKYRHGTVYDYFLRYWRLCLKPVFGCISSLRNRAITLVCTHSSKLRNSDVVGTITMII